MSGSSLPAATLVLTIPEHIPVVSELACFFGHDREFFKINAQSKPGCTLFCLLLWDTFPILQATSTKHPYVSPSGELHAISIAVGFHSPASAAHHIDDLVPSAWNVAVAKTFR